MKKLNLFLKKSGVSIADKGILKQFTYEYDPQMTVVALVALCQKVHEDIKKFIKNSTDERFDILFNYPVSSDITICRFVAGWLNETDEGNDQIFKATILVERMVKG